MADIASSGQIQNLASLILSNNDLQIQLVILIVGLVVIFSIYFKFSNWVRMLKFSYTRPHLSRFIRKAILPFFALALISSTNFYIQIYDLFDESEVSSPSVHIVKETFAKILNSVNILIIGYTVSQLVPAIIRKYDSDRKEKEDFESWKIKHGFSDDSCGKCDICSGKRYGICENTPDLFHEIFRWMPPTEIPAEFTKEEFKKYLDTEDGRRHLENHRINGMSIGSYQAMIKDPFKKWKEVEREKYGKYLNFCLSGNNASGRILSLKIKPSEIYSIDDWMEVKRQNDYEYVIPGGKPPGYFEQKQKSMPRSVTQIVPVGIFIATILGVVAWWGIDLIVIATATGGLGVGVGLALKQTMENYFAYLIIRKNKTIQEGDRIQLNTGFNGYVHSITPGVTYIRHALNESLAIIPTNQLINEQILNFTKEFSYVPSTVKVGVSYLNDPKQVASILIKVGKLAMQQSKDTNGKHLVIHKNCPYLDENKPSCGCDKNILEYIDQPIVRFDDFNESALDFSLWVYAKDYGSHSKVETDMRMIMYDEFKKCDIRIPWPTRTIYHGDEKKEAEEISKLDDKREGIKSQFGIGDISQK